MTFLEKIKSFLSRKSKSDFAAERRKCIRFRPSKQDPLFGEIPSLESGKVRRAVSDLSLVAAAVQITKDETEHYKPKQRIPIALFVEGKKIPYETEVIRIEKDKIVLRYLDPTEEKSHVLSTYFMKILGRTLRKGTLKEVEKSNGPSIWVHGEYNSDLFAWLDQTNKSIIKMLYLFADNLLDYKPNLGIRTGIVQRKLYSDSLDFAKREENSRIYDPKPKQEIINLARITIENANLGNNLKNQIINLFSNR